jgi:hypothetical protein
LLRSSLPALVLLALGVPLMVPVPLALAGQNEDERRSLAFLCARR